VALLRRRGLGRVAVEPGGDVVVVELLAPQHPGERLPHHERLVRGRRIGRQVGVERVGLGAAGGDHLVEVRPATGGEPQAQLHGLAARHREPVPRRALAAALRGVDGGHAGHDVVVDAVLRVAGARHPEEPLGVGLVVAEQQLGTGTDVERERAEERVLGAHGRSVGDELVGRRAVPRPGVAVPEVRQHVQRVGVVSGVGHPDRHEQVERGGLGVVDVDDPVAVVVEHPGVQQLELRVAPPAPGVLRDQPSVGVGGARVVVAPPVPGVAGQRVEEPPVLLGVLTVVALVAGQAEDAFFEDGVAARERAWSCGR
jgi:hypothetical protein